MPRKVFELAKELDMAPLDLVEALKAKGFAVRNHMTELSDSEVESYLSAIKKDEVKEDSTVKKKVVRKKVPTETKSAKPAEKKVVERKAVAETTEEDDKKVVERITAKNNLESYIYQVKNSLNE